MNTNQDVSAFSATAASSRSSSVVRFPKKRERVLISEIDASWRKPVLDRLTDLMRLPSCWDGYSGEPVSLDNAMFALRLIEACCRPDDPTPSIVPGSGGDLQIEWHLTGGDIELHVRGPNDVKAWCLLESRTDSDPDGLEQMLTNDFTEVAQWIREVVEPPRDVTSGTAAA